jgi:DNA helicase-2/ATP-dependent DNA helicase PcrA
MRVLHDSSGQFAVWQETSIPAATNAAWPSFVKLMRDLASDTGWEVPAQIHEVLSFYQPYLEEIYDNPEGRLRDLEQLQQVSERFADRRSLLTDLALDPPTSTGELVDRPDQEDDYLILSTVHSAKGLEWDVVYTISAVDGTFPFSRAQNDPDQLEEERRLFYVALTRARNQLYVTYPQQVYQAARRGFGGDAFGFARLSRFVTADVMRCFQQVSPRPGRHSSSESRFFTPHSTERSSRRFRPKF